MINLKPFRLRVVDICTMPWSLRSDGISFLEAPLRFTALHITVALGVGSGRVVFQALNKVEIVLCALAYRALHPQATARPAEILRTA